MAYTLNTTNGSILTTLSDGTIDTSTSLTFVGKNYAGYGEILNENFLRLLENHADSIEPAAPLEGQLWWDTVEGLLKVFDGGIFKTISAASAAGTAPTSTIVGDIWFDTVNEQLKVFNGTSFILIGPSFTAGAGTSGTVVDTVTDSGAVNHIVVKMFVNDAIIGIFSKDAEFTPAPAIAGFSTIAPGLNLSTTIPGALLTGTSTNSATVNNLNTANLMQKNITETTTGQVSFLNDNGINVGANSDLGVGVAGGNAVFVNSTNNGDIIFRVNQGGAVNTTTMLIDGATGGINIFGDMIPSGTTHNLGNATNKFSTIYATTFSGTSTSAQYADLAERFAADTVMEVGTVVELGGVNEITTAINDLSDNVFGVVSSQAAYLMNSEAGNDATHPAIALSGRVPVKVIGAINKGDRLVSAGNGLARAATVSEANSFNVIGRALENKTSVGTGLVEAIVTVK